MNSINSFLTTALSIVVWKILICSGTLNKLFPGGFQHLLYLTLYINIKNKYKETQGLRIFCWVAHSIETF